MAWRSLCWNKIVCVCVFLFMYSPHDCALSYTSRYFRESIIVVHSRSRSVAAAVAAAASACFAYGKDHAGWFSVCVWLLLFFVVSEVCMYLPPNTHSHTHCSRFRSFLFVRASYGCVSREFQSNHRAVGFSLYTLPPLPLFLSLSLSGWLVGWLVCGLSSSSSFNIHNMYDSGFFMSTFVRSFFFLFLSSWCWGFVRWFHKHTLFGGDFPLVCVWIEFHFEYPFSVVSPRPPPSPRPHHSGLFTLLSRKEEEEEEEMVLWSLMDCELTHTFIQIKEQHRVRSQHQTSH